MISAPALSYRQYANIGIKGFTAWKPTIQLQNVTSDSKSNIHTLKEHQLVLTIAIF